MKKTIVFLILLISTGIHSQQVKIGTLPYRYRVKEQLPVLISTFTAGLFEGAMDQLDFHYDKPSQFWNPDLSYLNKYIDRDPTKGATWRGRYMIFTTDGWHLMKFGNHLSLISAIAFKSIYSIGVKKKWYWYVFEAGTYWLIERVGFQITYKLIKF